MAYVAGSANVRPIVVGFDRQDAATMLLRVVLGALILCHGIDKVVHGLGFVFGALAAAGLPSTLAYLCYAGEVVAPVLLIVGWWTRGAAVVVAVNMIAAILLVHTGQLLSLEPYGGWVVELQALFLVNAVVVALLGAGRFSVGGIAGRWN